MLRNPAAIMRTGFAAAVLLSWSLASLAGEPATDPKPAFRTDTANAQLPWYQPKPHEFPPLQSAHRIDGDLVSADFIHRRGQFRAAGTGELLDFTMPSYGSLRYLNAEADLRDVPLGTSCQFYLHQDGSGQFTRLAVMQDQFTVDASQGYSYRVDEIILGKGKLRVTRHPAEKPGQGGETQELRVNERTSVRKGDKVVKLSDLAVGDELLVNVSGKGTRHAGRCIEIWVGANTHGLATQAQRKHNAAFVKTRGVPAWIDKIDGETLTVTLLSGDPSDFQQSFMKDLALGKEMSVTVANDELRTWNPPVDRERCHVQEVRKLPVDGYGTSGVGLVFTPTYMLEGFRKGRIVRIFGAGWPVEDSFYGESLMGYGYERLRTAELMELTPKEYPAQFPYRTDYGNEHLPWYALKPGVPPPPFAEHLVFGELRKIDTETHRGQFLLDRRGQPVEITLIPGGSVRYLDTDAKLDDLPIGVRFRLHLFQDAAGAFTQASVISDEFSYFVANGLTYGVIAFDPDEGKLQVSRTIPPVKNYNGDTEQPPAIGRTELRVDTETRIWKRDQRLKPTDLVPGDVLLVNLTAELPGKPSRCTDIWVGSETHTFTTEQQRRDRRAAK